MNILYIYRIIHVIVTRHIFFLNKKNVKIKMNSSMQITYLIFSKWRIIFFSTSNPFVLFYIEKILRLNNN